MEADSITVDDVLADLAEYFVIPEPPAGAFTIQEVQKRFGLSLQQARDKLDHLIEAGKIERLGRGFGSQYAYYRKVSDGTITGV